MDWKIPATIIILTVVISLGLIPFFSPEFSSSVGGLFDGVEGMFKKIFEKEHEFTGEIVFTLSTRNLSKIKIGTPTKMKIEVKKPYTFAIDDREFTVKDPITFTNFTGIIDFENFFFSGNVLGISTKSFEMKGGAKVSSFENDFSNLSVENIKLGELTLTNGEINTESPQKLNAKINETIKIYGFNGILIYKNRIITFVGNCTKLETKSFSLG